MTRMIAAILVAWAGFLASGRVHAATVDGGLLTNTVSAVVDSYVGVPSGTVSYSATALVMVCTPTIEMVKRASMTVQGAGGTVTFCIWAVNASAFTSAFNVVLEDLIPSNFSYVKGGQDLWPSSLVTMGYAQLHPTGSCCAYTWNDDPPDGQTTLMGPVWLKWAVSELGPNQSALMCFKMRLL